MPMHYKAKIIGTGMYVPPKVVTNKDLEAIIDTSDEWIRQRSGIEERRHIDDESGTSDLALNASLEAIKSANIEKQDIDLIVLATLSPDHQFPGSSALLQAKLGLSKIPAMDLRAQCTGFIYSLNVAKLFIESGQYKTVLVVGAEVHSPVLDMTTNGRDVSVLFGDGSGALVMQRSEDGTSGVLDCSLHSQGEFASRLWMERPGTAGGKWLTADHLEAGLQFPKMEGRYVFKHAVSNLVEVVKENLEKNKLTIDDIDHFLFHQANLRINEKVAEFLNIPREKIHSNIQKYGNCSAASIPILLDECVKDGKIKRGDKILAAAFGAGFTWGASVIEW